MSNDPFYKADKNYKKDRKIEEFPSKPPAIEVTPAEFVGPVYEEVLATARLAGKMTDRFAQLADKYYIPIELDENEVRAAHLRIGGDGVAISFAQFKEAIDRRKYDNAETMSYNFKGFGRGDYRVLERKRIERLINKIKGKGGGGGGGSTDFSALESFGNQALILWALNMLLGSYASQQHSDLVQQKQPQNTERSEIIKEIILAILMFMYIYGLTQTTAESVAKADQPASFSMITQSETFQEVHKSLLANPMFDMFKASMRISDDETIITYSLEYIDAKGTSGYDSWIAYLTSRHVEESCLRTYKSGDTYRQNGITMLPQHREAIHIRNVEFNRVLRSVLSAYSDMYGPGDICCFVRFIWQMPEEILTLTQSALKAKSDIGGSLNRTISKWLNKISGIVSDPWNFLSDRLLKIIDAYFDRVADKLMEVLELNSDVPDIIRACLPAGVILDSILDTMEEVKALAKSLLKSVGAEVEEFAKQSIDSWTKKQKMQQSDKMREVIDRVVQERKRTGELDEEGIVRIVNDINAVLRGPDMSGLMTESTSKFTSDVRRACETLGDWQKIKDALGLDVSEMTTGE